MKKAIFKFFIFLGLVSSWSMVLSQSLNTAIKFTDNEQYSKAAAVFKSLLKKEPQNGAIYFYYGENYFKADNIDSAKIFYGKGIEVNGTNPLNYVGLGKVDWYENNVIDAKSNFYKASTLSQHKNATVLLKTAEAYINADKKDLPEAIKLLGLAEKLEPKNPELFILKGDAFLESMDGSKAISNYEKAVELDKSSVKAILRIGQLYGRAKNYNLALENYQKAITIDSTYAPAYREKAELLYKAGQVDKAIAQYQTYLTLNDDLAARIRYASFLFIGKDYQGAIDEIKSVMENDTNEVNLYRILAYSHFETGNYSLGIEAIEKFFKKAEKRKFKILPSDYVYHGKLLSKSGEDSLAAGKLMMALKLDSTQAELYGELASIYLKMKVYPRAIENYEKKIAIGTGVNANDYYGLGRASYYQGQYAKADSAFAQITISNPTLPLGYLWRARVNSQLDPESKEGLAKPYYENYIEQAIADLEKNKKDLIDAYSYLGYYYLLNKDEENAKTYWGKVKELDPTNAKQKAFFESLNKPKK